MIPESEARAFVLARAPASIRRRCRSIRCSAVRRRCRSSSGGRAAVRQHRGRRVRRGGRGHRRRSPGSPVRLEVVGTLAAGAPPTLAVAPGEAVRIMTGRRDAAGRRRRRHGGGHRDRRRWSSSVGATAVKRRRRRAPRGRRRARGRRRRSRPARVIRPAHLGVLASSASSGCRCTRGARVGVLSTGDELVEGGAPAGARPDPREQPDDAARARRRRPAASRSTSGSVRDDKDEIAEAAPPRRRSECDALVTVGRREHGRLRPREGRARRDRRHAVDADRHQAGQAVRVRVDRREAHAGVRAAGQPGVVARVASSCSPGRRCAR